MKSVWSLFVSALMSTAAVQGQDVVISEFLTSNNVGIRDENGERVDWIEIFNRGTGTVNLLNWKLRDSSDEWVFPATNLAPGRLLLVFASEKNRRVPGAPLHTNFRLSSGGEYLGLIRPDDTVASEFSPYEPQVPDVSYGFGERTTNQVWVGTNASLRALVPNAGTGASWTATNYNDSAWILGTNGVGFGTTNAAGGSVLPFVKTDIGGVMSNVNASAYVRIPFTVTDTSTVSLASLRLRYDDGYVAYINGLEISRANAPALPAYDSAATGAHSPLSVEEIRLGQAFFQNGANVLAIHGLNIDATNEDFVVYADLSAAIVVDSSAQPVYFTTPSPTNANSSGVAILGPAILDPTHSPNVPTDTEDVGVTVRVQPTFNDVASVVVRYRVMYNTEQETPMFDDGFHGDGVAGDRIYGATLPFSSASTNGQMLRWHFRAVDTLSNTSRWPLFASPGDTEYLGTIVETNVISQLPVVHLFVSSGQTGAIDQQGGGRISAFYDGEFYDNIHMQLRGNSTSGFNKKSHRIEFNRDHPFRHPGALFGPRLSSDPSADAPRVRHTSFVADYPDPAYMRQGLGYWLCQLFGAPAPFYYPMRLHMNTAFYQLANHNDVHDEELLERLGYDPRGALYNAAGQVTPGRASTGGFEKKTRRWDTADAEYTVLANGISETLPVAARRTNVFELFDLPEMLNYLVVGRWIHENDDVWANLSLYYDNDGDRLWRIVPFDVNLSWGAIFYEGLPTCGPYVEGVQATNDAHKAHPFYGGSEITACNSGNYNRVYDAIFDIPETREMFLRRMRTLLDTYVKPPGTPVGTTLIEQKIMAWYNLIREEALRDRARWQWPSKGGQCNFDPGINVTNGVYGLITNFFLARRDHFYIKHSAEMGTQPIGVFRTNNAGIPFAQPAGVTLNVVDFDYNPVSGNQEQEYICVSNPAPFAVDISGWRIEGAVDFTFKPGTVIPSFYALYISPNVVAFRARTTGPRGNQGRFVVGPYQGQLSARGETIVVRDDRGRLVSTNRYAGNETLAQRSLRITEIMYHPSKIDANDANEYEYIELRNIGTNAINLAGVRLIDGVQFAFTSGTLTQGQRILVVKNQALFPQRYGGGLNIAGQYTGSLDNAGERIRLVDSVNEEVLDFDYNNSWYPITDGHGFSLVVADENAEPDLWDSKTNWRASGQLNGSPGAADPAPAVIAPVLINEALSRSDTPPPTDSIELYNPGTNAANLGGWYLTDDFAVPQKYRITNGTMIAAGGYLVFDEAQFNNHPNPLFNFALSSDDDEVFLFSADGAGNLTGYFHGFDFGAAEDGVTFGRHVTSTGEEHFISQNLQTLGGSNAGARVGPVVINEIMYHPPDEGGINDSANEYIELLNITGNPVDLFDASTPTNTWRLAGGADFDFAQGVTLVGGEMVMLLRFDPATNSAVTEAFRTKYGVPAGVRLFGPYDEQLDNASDDVELMKPTTPDTNGVPYVLVDKVDYKDSTPWPPGADGFGLSLQRVDSAAYGNDPANWTAAPPTPAGATGTTDPMPEITVEPSDQRVVAGDDVTFTVSASGANLQYRWHYDGAPIPGATGSMLQLDDVSAAQAGDYRVVVFNASGSAVSRPATLRVDVPVLILAHPRSQRIFAGSNATFTVSAYSSTPVTYQWRKNGDDIPGATSATLMLTNVSGADNGDYTVVVTDAQASLISEPGNLLVLVRAKVLQFTQSATVAAGSNVSFTAVVTNTATLPINFGWRTNSGFATNMFISSHTSTFTIFNVRTNQAYNVPVAVTNAWGTGDPGLTAPLPTLTVVVPPTNQTVAAGANATFTARVFDPNVRPRPSRVQWQYNSANIENATNLTLTVTNVQAGNTGTYSLLVTNPFLLVTPFHAELQIDSGNPTLAEPQILVNGHFQAILQGQSGRNYAVEYSTNLTNWSLLRSIAATSQSTPVADEDAAQSPQRFYRARLEP